VITPKLIDIKASIPDSVKYEYYEDIADTWMNIITRTTGKEFKGKRPSREAISQSDSQEISCQLWSPNVRCRVFKRPPLVPVLSQMNIIQKLTPYFFKKYFNIILPFTPRSFL
jgi:hypothetical protein